MRVKRQEPVTMKPGRAPKKAYQQENQIIPYDTKTMPLVKKNNDSNPTHVPKVHRHSTRVRRLQVHNIMANHVTKTEPPSIMSHHSPPPNLVCQTGDDWLITNNANSEVTI